MSVKSKIQSCLFNSLEKKSKRLTKQHQAEVYFQIHQHYQRYKLAQAIAFAEIDAKVYSGLNRFFK